MRSSKRSGPSVRMPGCSKDVIGWLILLAIVVMVRVFQKKEAEWNTGTADFYRPSGWLRKSRLPPSGRCK